MCGIVGEWRFDGRAVNRARLEQATSLISHRGPDDEGYLLAAPDHGCALPRSGRDSVLRHLPPIAAPDGLTEQAPPTVGFGFRRLAIIDLSEAGHQPMASVDGRSWIVFNGEIYNHVELREELASKGHAFRGHCDTEVILAAYAEWGPECLARFNGMWAFALLDLPRRRLFAARDRFGIKPFYYRVTPEAFQFGSEIKAVRAFSDAPAEVNDRVVADFLIGGFVDCGPETFYRDVTQLPPAHYLMIDGGQVTLSRYWQLDLDGQEDSRPYDVLARDLRDLFADVIRLHLRSDVPVGTCLSGGIDSSVIACLTRAQLGPHGHQETFSAYFDNPVFDERPYIRQVVERTGARANYVSPSPEQLLADLPRLLAHQDEPFATTSIYAQWTVMGLARSRGVKVLLDGQGGDELFAGYHTYYGAWFADLLRRGRLGVLAREALAYRRMHRAPMHDLLFRTVEGLASRSLSTMARRVLQGETVGVSRDLPRASRHPGGGAGGRGLRARLHELLTSASLPGLLRYEDRDSMAFSIEARVPFLDVRLVEFAFRLPGVTKIRDGWTKAILRDGLSEDIPVGVARRTDKMGFLTPEAEWLRGPLAAWAREMVFSPEFSSRPYFDVPAAHAYFERFMAGEEHRSGPVWRWIVLDAWIRQQVEGAAIPVA